jgi:hypothetical protein
MNTHAKAVVQEVSMLKVLKAPKLSPQQIVWEQEALRCW